MLVCVTIGRVNCESTQLLISVNPALSIDNKFPILRSIFSSSNRSHGFTSILSNSGKIDVEFSYCRWASAYQIACQVLQLQSIGLHPPFQPNFPATHPHSLRFFALFAYTSCFFLGLYIKMCETYDFAKFRCFSVISMP